METVPVNAGKYYTVKFKYYNPSAKGTTTFTVGTSAANAAWTDYRIGDIITLSNDTQGWVNGEASFVADPKTEQANHLFIRVKSDTTGSEAYFDNFQVYTATADGTLKTIVSRPWWHHLFSYGLCLSIAFIGAMGIGICILSEKAMDYVSVKKTVVFENQKAKRIKNYFKVTTFVHLIYTVLNIGLAFFTGVLIIGIMPLGIHMIVSNWILWNKKDRLRCKEDETHVVEFWGILEIASFVMAFLSVIVASAIAG